MFVAGLGTGTWSCYGPYFSELFPTRVRGAAMSVIMNVTRGVQFVAPLVIAAVAGRWGLAGGIALAAGFAVLAGPVGVDPPRNSRGPDRDLAARRTMIEPVPVAQPTFRRAVSRWEIVFFSLNDVIGSGVYLLPAAAAAVLGFASLGAVVLAGFAVLLLVLCFAEAGSYFDRPGGAYLYTREAFGELIGFEVGWMTWLARVASVASLSVGFSQALGYLWPAANAGMGRALAITIPLLVLTLINIVGVKSGVRTAVFLAVTKIVPLLIFIAVGIFVFSRDARQRPSRRAAARSARRRCCCSSPTPASRTRRRRRASSRTRGGTCPSP